MSEDLSQAVSFANGYFALADGLVDDLANYLAEDVILDWFGQTIKGRKNVSTFMKFQNINSRHIIDEINPSSTIEYRKIRPLRRKYYSMGSCANKTLADDDEDNGIRYKRKCYSEGKMDTSADETDEMDVESESVDFSKASVGLQNYCHKLTLALNNLNLEKLKLDSQSTATSKPSEEAYNAKDNVSDDDDDDNYYKKSKLNESYVTEQFLSKLEPQPTNFDEIEQKINYFNETNKAGFKNEHGQGDGPMNESVNLMKYVEVCGVIKSARFFSAKQIRKDLRQRQCRLQIAYSNRDTNSNSFAKTESIQIKKTEVDNVESTSAMLADDVNRNCYSSSSNSNSNLLSLQEIRELGNKLVPHDENANYSDNDEDCYYNNDRNKFLRCLDLQITDNGVKVNENDFVTPNYKRQELTLDNSPKRLFNETETARDFVFNYIIHLIIYESNTKCRLNLSYEFDG
ncbi:uncharacterized protein LOC123261892 [Cotesia glomerata]|uniref:Uncharacterized protein n=1 Tax=Cotesia glomerata TaxID=32391 RepID=A0AAV7HZW8_COTGL|nr:uncharacterized protein LOC123261892 [Cotesia glomerata]XP_044579692.1 uncharacterized protein LOC123261892 [Cotesia glomerata]XP_044579693.1 uncharacterized protein LOC123261892 [Cotesia glomerata]XP_044579694.1 uncharacterized protein LOC123261892 [Cotesia glomerata]KAH0550638.1 hypothetical protein KQX54_020389 [Cotesia glomerata]